ncbi:tetratricopeptide repeat protein [Methylacidiphilum caldifontis]|uniref:Uncharacterized protein n=1 Tax=Methylacidiphilum caldifontis TaxID=2795386 RepID=A0A4Y8PHH5_9BACT|nr:tetratricopeptide repeat protein [Methylacidiphilum caldifontis]QSR88672.1 tetratricopeptide repeat protein [Methylacidiphilum caldifontis]TFE73290.1 hypothetical protein A7Q10_03175 [Methylacidiphilum caldifontis]
MNKRRQNPKGIEKIENLGAKTSRVLWLYFGVLICFLKVGGWSADLEDQQEGLFAKAYQDALVAFKRLDLDEAQRSILKAQELKPKDPKAIVLAARIFLQKKEYDKAEKELYRVFKLQPDYGAAYQYLGEVFYAKKDYKEALYRFEQAAMHDSSSKEILLKRIYCTIGLGRMDAAENLLSGLSAFDESSPGYYFAKAALCRMRKKYNEEKKLLDTARIVYGNDAFSQYLRDYESLFAKKETLD